MILRGQLTMRRTLGMQVDIRVVLPEPVSPSKTVTSFCRITSMRASLPIDSFSVRVRYLRLNFGRTSCDGKLLSLLLQT